MNNLTRTLIVAGLASFALVAYGQEKPSSNLGIYVDRVKVFSDADLRAKFRDLARQLSPLLGIDPAKITAGLFQLQGIEADRSNTSITGTTSPIPGSTITDQKNFPPDKDPVTGKQVETTNPQLTASVPKSDLPADTLKTPDQIALSAPERIAEYMQLFYETTNLQMLLNRAISDIVDSGGTNARVPIILGIPVTVVADPKVQGAMAQVWVRVTPTSTPTGKESINVITQIPQENSYNVASITNHVSNVGLGAVTTLLNIGFSQTRQRERQYLVKTYDTISLSSFNGSADNYGAEFGWQLRPVLGNRNITPGRRTFMVALSLPPGEKQTLQIQVYTQWFKYDKRTGNVGKALTCKILSSETKKDVDIKNFSPALKTSFLYNGVQSAIEGRLVGTGFSPDLPYYSGGRRVAVSTGTDDMTSVQLSFTKDDLLTNDLRVGTIFGSLRPLQAEISDLPPDLTPAIFRQIEADAWEQDNDVYKVQLRLPGNWEKALNDHCIVQIGDFFPGISTKDRPSFEFCKDKNETISEYIVVPSKSLAGRKTVILSAPFLCFPKKPQTSKTIEDPYPPVRTETTLQVHNAFAITKVVQSGKGEGVYGGYTIFTITGRGLRNLSVLTPDILQKTEGTGPKQPKTLGPQTIDMRLTGDLSTQDRAKYFQEMYRSLNAGANKSTSGDVVLVPISNDALKFTKIFVVTKKVSDNGAPFDIDDKPDGLPTRDFTRIVTVEPKKEAPPAPEIKSIDSVKLNHIGAVMVRGENLDRIKKVIIGKDEVKFVGPEEVEIAGKKENVYYIVLPASIAKTAGPRSVVFVLDDDSILTGSFNVGP